VDTTAGNVIRLRYAATCATCGAALPPGSRAAWDRAAKRATCEACLRTPSVKVDAPASEVPLATSGPAGAGGSARREYERRRQRDEATTLEEHPRIGRLLLALRPERQSTRAWARGAVGEERVGEHLRKRGGPSLRLLDDRRIPGSRANIDHIAITATGVYVIDTKHYAGQRVEVKRRRGKPYLSVGGRDRTRLVEGMAKQVDAVRRALDHAGHGEVPVTPVLCFTHADWPPLVGPPTFRGVLVIWPRRLARMLRSPGSLPDASITAITATLAEALPPA
jgi:hypothetical protein